MLADLKRDLAGRRQADPTGRSAYNGSPLAFLLLDIFIRGPCGWRLANYGKKGKAGLEVMETRPTPDAPLPILNKPRESQLIPPRVFPLTQRNQRRQVRRGQRRSAAFKDGT